MKVCTICKQPKTADCFYMDNSRKDKLTLSCKDCHKEAYRKAMADPQRRAAKRKTRAKWLEANKDSAKETQRCCTLRKKYGITAAEFNSLLASQDNRCAICGSSESKSRGRMHVDHNHKTGAIRGILCQACNVTLGKMEDSPELLRKAAAYLEENR